MTASAASIEDLKPIIQPDASDSSALDNVFELWCAAIATCRWSSA